MKQVMLLTSTYSSDEFGVCSALYELGGMVVMHDASGCNSTYTTHDEPRWYDMDSMIYISAISEMEAIMGDDGKLIEDAVETAQKLKPAFLALVGAPIPYMTGTDFPAIAKIISARTGIPCFGFATNGMQNYTKGISMALEKIADIYCTEPFEKPSDRLRVNLLGATPLDFSVNGTVERIKDWLSENGMEAGACFAMGDDLTRLSTASSAHVNLVLSCGGLAAAKQLKERFQIPYVAGVPYGARFAKVLAERLKEAASSGISGTGYKRSAAAEGAQQKKVAVIGESILSASLAAALEAEDAGLSCRVLCPVDTEESLLRVGDAFTPEEEDVAAALSDADLVIADPLYRPLCGNRRFIPLPHTAFSGRLYEKEMPVLIGDLTALKVL